MPGTVFMPGHSHVELFTLSNSKWQNKRDYNFTNDIYAYSILALEEKFIIFGGLTRKVMTNQVIKSCERIYKVSFS